jgi:hypothetical protein
MESVETQRRMPLSLRVVAYLWLAAGLCVIPGAIANLLQGKPNIPPLMLLGLYFGIGLLLLKRSAWYVALIFSGVGVFFLVLMILETVSLPLGDYLSKPMTFTFTNEITLSIPLLIFYPIAFAILLGQMWILLRKDIRQLFQ